MTDILSFVWKVSGFLDYMVNSLPVELIAQNRVLGRPFTYSRFKEEFLARVIQVYTFSDAEDEFEYDFDLEMSCHVSGIY